MNENHSAGEADRQSPLPLQDISPFSPEPSTRDDVVSHDGEPPNDAPTSEALSDIPAVGAASSNNSIEVCWNHVKDERARTPDDSMDKKMRLDESRPSRLIEPNRRLVFLDASSPGGNQSPKPVAVVSPMRQSVTEVASETVERDRPRGSSISPSFMVCQTSQTFRLADSFLHLSPRPRVTEVVSRHRSDLCATPTDLPSSGHRLDGAQPPVVLFDATQEQNSKFNEPTPTTQLNELDVLSQSNFFYGHLSRSKVKSKLRHSQDGTFLVRYSSDSKFQFALSIKTPNGVTSVRLARNADGSVRLDCDPCQADRMPAFASVLDLVINYARDETGRRPCRSHCIYLEGVGLSETVLDLRRPFEESPASLGHLCRRRINALVPWYRRMDLIRALVDVAPKDSARNLVDFLESYPYRI